MLRDGVERVDPLLVLAVDPQAPEAVRTLVGAGTGCCGGSRLPEVHVDVTRGGLRGGWPKVGYAVLTVTALQVEKQVLSQEPAGSDAVVRWIHQVIGLANWLAWGSAALLVAVLLSKVVAVVVASREDVAVQQAVTGALPYLVLQSEVDTAGARLLARAQAAAATVLVSDQHAGDLLDRQRGNTVVPAEVWAIATSLRDSSRLAARTPVQDRAQAEHRIQQLAQANAAVQARVEALEDYARAVRRAEKGYRRWQQPQELAGDCGEQQADEDAVLDLLAAAAGHQVAAAELKSMASRADELAEVLDPDSEPAP